MKKLLLSFIITAWHLNSFSQSPTISIIQPTCISPFGTAEVTSPINNAGPVASNLYISEVTDANLGGLSYIEIYNGTGAEANLSNYKLKVFLNGFATPSCDFTLSGYLTSGNTFVAALGSNINLGGVIPNITFDSCGGFNTNDAVMLTTINNEPIDLWGSLSGTVFTPLGLPGYTYRRHIDAPVPSLTWSPEDWDVLDLEDYSNVGVYSTAVIYQYSLDQGPFQASPVFAALSAGIHIITVQNMNNGETAQTSFEVLLPAIITPNTNFIYLSPVCRNIGPPLVPMREFNFTSGGVFTATFPLVIDAASGVINLTQTPPGSYLITYSVPADNTLCLASGMSSFNLVVLPVSADPQGDSVQVLNLSNPTLNDLAVSPENVSWYSSYNNALGLTNALPSTTGLVDGASYYAVNNINGCPSNPFAVTVHLNLSTAAFSDLSLQILPNPANALLTVNTPQHLTIDKITISDLSGKVVMTKTAVTQNQLNIEQLQAGMYLLAAFSGDQKFQAKLIKQ